MNRRHIAGVFIGCCLLLGTSRSASAQYSGTAAGGYFSGHADNPVGPTVSPYLNLLNNNNVNSGFTNYQSLVRPLEDMRQDSQQQSAQIQQLQHAVKAQSGAIRGTGLTGPVSRYLNYSHYYTFNRK